MRRLLAAMLLLFCGSAGPGQQDSDAILIFTHTSGYRHESIPAGIKAIEGISRARGLDVETSEDPAIFSNHQLRRFRAIIFLSTTTDPKDPASEWLVGARRAALQQFAAQGGGIVAIHAAADSHYHWPWYGGLIGGRFARHPPGTPRGRVSRVAGAHPANNGLPNAVERVDEWYYFDDLDPGSAYLMTLDPGSIGETDVNPNPMAWTRQMGKARIFYTAMGHTKESYSEPFFLRHLANGLDWVLQTQPKDPDRTGA